MPINVIYHCNAVQRGARKGWITHDFLKSGEEEKLIVEAGGRAELTHKSKCH